MRLRRLAVAVLVLGLLATDAESSSLDDSAPPVVESSASVSASSIAVTPSSSVSDTPTAQQHISPLNVTIPVAPVVEIAYPAVGYESSVLPMTIGGTGVITPPDFAHTFRVTDRGSDPGTTVGDTTYFACHTHSKRYVPCNLLISGNPQLGQEIIVTTEAGKLVYRVSEILDIPADKLASNQEVWGVNPGRLAWITCLYVDGKQTGSNRAIIAQLQP